MKKILLGVGTLFLLIFAFSLLSTFDAQAQPAEQGGSECDQDPHCEVLEDPSDVGEYTAPGHITKFCVKAGQNLICYGEEAEDHPLRYCWDVNISGDYVSWERQYNNNICQDPSHMQVSWKEGNGDDDDDDNGDDNGNGHESRSGKPSCPTCVGPSLDETSLGSVGTFIHYSDKSCEVRWGLYGWEVCVQSKIMIIQLEAHYLLVAANGYQPVSPETVSAADGNTYYIHYGATEKDFLDLNDNGHPDWNERLDFLEQYGWYPRENPKWNIWYPCCANVAPWDLTSSGEGIWRPGHCAWEWGKWLYENGYFETFSEAQTWARENLGGRVGIFTFELPPLAQ